MIKKIFSFILALAAVLCMLSGCSDMSDINSDGILYIVCTTFPQYDWVRNITKDVPDVHIELLTAGGTDLHSYQPSAKDIIKIATADIFIYTGGDSDKWVDEVLEASRVDNIVLLSLMRVLPEERLYCVEAAGEEGHNHEDNDKHNHAKDEHVWLSVKNALTFISAINTALCEVDPENASLYYENYMDYRDALEMLDAEYQRTIYFSEKDTLVFADRFPFIYLTKDYGLSYYAAFSGCSSESEASFETITRLSGKIDELGLSHILVTETSDGTVAKTVRDCTRDKNQEILTMNALQSVTSDCLSQSYIDVMRENLEILKTALS